MKISVFDFFSSTQTKDKTKKKFNKNNIQVHEIEYNIDLYPSRVRPKKNVIKTFQSNNGE